MACFLRSVALVASGLVPARPGVAGPADVPAASADVARALLQRGRTALEAAQYEPARAAFEAAASVATEAGAEREAGAAHRELAGALYAMGRTDEALPPVEEALRIFTRLGDDAGRAASWNVIGHVRHARSEYREAFAAYRKAYELWDALGDRGSAARALNNVGNCHKARSELDEAQDHYERALRIFEEIGDRRSALVVTNNIGDTLVERGDYAEARELNTRSLAVAEEMGDQVRMSKVLDSRGHIEMAAGAYARALESFGRSLAITERLGLRFQQLETSNNIGLVHHRQGNYELAIEAYKRGLRLNKRMGGTTLVCEGLYNIAAAARGLGQTRRAEANYRASLRACEQKTARVTASSLHDLGRMAVQAGRLEEAGTLLDRSLTMREQIGDRPGAVESLNGLALLRLAQGRPQDALELARQAAGIASAHEHAEPLWEAETVAGQALRRLGRTEEARASFRQAVDVIEDLRDQVLPRPHDRERFFEGKVSPYHELMTLALEGGATEEALQLAERSKARVLSDLLRGGEGPLDRALSADERREENLLQARLIALNLQVQAERQRKTPDAQHLESLVADRQAARREYETFEAAAYARHPELRVQRGRADVFRLAEAGPLLRDGSVAILEYVVTEADTYLFVLTRGAGTTKLESHRIRVGRAAVAAQARRLRERISGRSVAFAEDARELHRLLLPAAARLASRAHLVVVPDGPLWEVPFQALQDAAGRFVIESAAVSYAPSLTVLREMLARPGRRGPSTLLAMGKADFGAPARRSRHALMSELGPLPDAERQVERIAALYPQERRATFLGDEAREDRFKSQAPRFSILHLATHGRLEEASPLYSHVVLSPGTDGSSRDGLLEAWELLDLELDADLVVLSACETGRGRIAPGEGIVGTMWAFFVAGARSLLVSQWKVESSSTSELMTAFHRGLAPGAGRKASFLREAGLAVMRRPEYSHPFYWAGFTLVGDPY